MQVILRERNDLIEAGSIPIGGVDDEQRGVEHQWFVAAAAKACFKVGQCFGVRVVMTGMPRARFGPLPVSPENFFVLRSGNVAARFWRWQQPGPVPVRTCRD